MGKLIAVTSILNLVKWVWNERKERKRLRKDPASVHIQVKNTGTVDMVLPSDKFSLTYTSERGVRHWDYNYFKNVSLADYLPDLLSATVHISHRENEDGISIINAARRTGIATQVRMVDLYGDPVDVLITFADEGNT